MPSTIEFGTALEQIRRAQARHDLAREEGWAALETLFRAGQPPTRALEGVYEGEMIAFRLAPGLTQLVEAVAARWMPWLGKAFDAERAEGVNLLSMESLWLTRLLWPFYRHRQPDGPRRYRAFRFRTFLGPGKFDGGQAVLKIDYDLPENPRLDVRRVLDEVVQVEEGVYLGKWHIHWWWGQWSTVAFFVLRG